MRVTARAGRQFGYGAEISPTLVRALLGRIADRWVRPAGSDAWLAPTEPELSPGSMSGYGKTIG